MTVYVGFVILALLIGLCIKSNQMFKLYIFLLSLGLAVLAYHMDVLPESDLANHHGWIDLFRREKITFSYSFSRLNAGSFVYFWLLSFLPDNNYFQAISVFICYILMFSLAYQVCKDNDAPKSVFWVCVAAILTAYNFYMMANCIRYWLVFSVFFYLLYSELVGKKSKLPIWAGYVLLVAFHYGALLLVAARIVALVVNNTKNPRKVKLTNLVLLAACGVGAVLLLKSSFFSTAITEKIQGYATYDTRGTWQTIVGFLRVITVCVLIYHGFKTADDKYKEYFIAILCICAIPVLDYNNYTLILRFGDAVIATASVAIVLSDKISAHPGIALNRMNLYKLLLFACMAICFAAFIMFDYQHLTFNF